MIVDADDRFADDVRHQGVRVTPALLPRRIGSEVELPPVNSAPLLLGPSYLRRQGDAADNRAVPIFPQ